MIVPLSRVAGTGAESAVPPEPRPRPLARGMAALHHDRPVRRVDLLIVGVVERLLDRLVLALAARLAQLAAALGLRVGQLLFGRLAGLSQGTDLVADVGVLGADVVVGKGLELGFEGVRLIDLGLEPSDLAVVRVDEAGKEAHGTRSIGRERGGACRATVSPRSPCRIPRRG